MHGSAGSIGSKFLELYAVDDVRMVVEIGSYNVNGSLRSACSPTSIYIGLDLEHGPGVDIVVQPQAPLPLRSAFADIVLTSSQMEHDPCFWRTFLELVRITKPGGFVYLNAPSNGFYHTYPWDCWRFYPDSGKALVEWARASGYELSLIESFVAEQFTGEPWNDFVAVFQVKSGVESSSRPFLADMFACTNVWKAGASAPEKRRDPTQDGAIISRQAEELASLRAQLSEAHALQETQFQEFSVLQRRLAAVEDKDSPLQPMAEHEAA